MNHPILCIYHANCADGFGAAWAFRMKFPDAEFIPASYGSEPPDVCQKHVVIVDFSYPKEEIDMISALATSLLVIDHHKTAQADLAHLSPPFYKHEIPPSGAYAVFDMEKSGARLVWDYFHSHESPPLLIQHIEDRDLWRYKLKHTKDYMAAVFSREFSFDMMDDLHRRTENEETYTELINEGRAINRFRKKEISTCILLSQRIMKIGDYVVPAAGVPYSMASEAGHIMSDGQLFAATYIDTPSERKFSLRSDGGFDVSQVAKLYGGGGHKSAAGFSVPRDHELAQA